MYYYTLIPRFSTCLLLLCNLTSFNELMRFWWFSCWYSTSVSYPLNEYSRFLMWWKLLSLWLKTFIGAILPHWNFQLNLKERFKSFSTQMRNLWISKLVSIAFSYRIVGVYRFLIRRFFDLQLALPSYVLTILMVHTYLKLFIHHNCIVFMI